MRTRDTSHGFVRGTDACQKPPRLIDLPTFPSEMFSARRARRTSRIWSGRSGSSLRWCARMRRCAHRSVWACRTSQRAAVPQAKAFEKAIIDDYYFEMMLGARDRRPPALGQLQLHLGTRCKTCHRRNQNTRREKIGGGTLTARQDAVQA